LEEISKKYVTAFNGIASFFIENKKMSKRQIIGQLKTAGFSRNQVKRMNLKFSNKLWKKCEDKYKKRGIRIIRLQLTFKKK
jgi:hypothetical protein